MIFFKFELYRTKMCLLHDIKYNLYILKHYFDKTIYETEDTRKC